jgi:hypothetical protein
MRLTYLFPLFKIVVNRPVDVKRNGRSAVCTIARYPVRSGPRQFASYLTDMDSLSVAVFTSPSAAAPVGHVDVPQLSRLSNNRPINGYDQYLIMMKT